MTRKQHQHIKIRGINYGYRIWEPDAKFETESEKLVILLHGFMGSGAIFEELSKELAHHARVIALDLLGHGSSEGAEMHYRFSTNEQVADLRTFIERMNDRPVILMGYSMGARLALSFAIKYPQLLAGLILESGSFGIEDPTEAQTRQSLDVIGPMKYKPISMIFSFAGMLCPFFKVFIPKSYLQNMHLFKSFRILFGWQIASLVLDRAPCPAYIMSWPN